MKQENKTDNKRHFMETLYIADPEIAEYIEAGLSDIGSDLPCKILETMAEDVVYGLSLEPRLGKTVANGYMALAKAGANTEAMEQYSTAVRDAMKEGPSLGRIMAGTLSHVIINGDRPFVRKFLDTIAMLRHKWLYAIAAEPLEVVTTLIADGSLDAGLAYMDLLHDLFSHDLTYNQYRRFAGQIPGMVVSVKPAGRAWTIEQLRRVAALDFDLACSFADALAGELSFLSRRDLEKFVDMGLEMYARDKTAGERFLCLESRAGIEACDRLRSTAVFAEMQQGVSRYIQARTGRRISVKPVSSIPGGLLGSDIDSVIACYDGRSVYLADEVAVYPYRRDNQLVYKALAWIEAGLFEFGTFDFDFERALEYCKGLLKNSRTDKGGPDMERFFSLFPVPLLAADLFSIIEYGRVKTLLEESYPGGARRFYSHLVKGISAGGTFMYNLCAVIALGAEPAAFIDGAGLDTFNTIRDLFYRHAAGKRFPEASAMAVSAVFDRLGHNFCNGVETYTTERMPYGLRVRPALFASAFGKYEQLASRVKEKIEKAGYRVYKTDLLKHLAERGGALNSDDITRVVRDGGGPLEGGGDAPDLSAMGLDEFSECYEQPPVYSPFAGSAFRYREWDNTIGDYLDDYVLVRENKAVEGDNMFYETVLERHRGLVKRIRYAFELLKPQGMAVLRKWREGDDFDYRQLIDFVVDRRCGLTPSERIYIKRLKQVRDVAVMLLIDVSRSTSNYVAGSGDTTVLDVEKEAAVLFCEALDVVGDLYSIAGFSGSGRLGVDYFVIKEFDDFMNDETRRCIGWLSPQRNTRMGAAVRHATAKLRDVPAVSRLLIIVTDGFPNDIGYKRERAIEDTRRALLEARAERIAVHTITVNIPGDRALDNVYGKVSHTVISDVRELPDRLLKIYGRLTG